MGLILRQYMVMCICKEYCVEQVVNSALKLDTNNCKSYSSALYTNNCLLSIECSVLRSPVTGVCIALASSYDGAISSGLRGGVDLVYRNLDLNIF
jgi:hypothetical protein